MKSTKKFLRKVQILILLIINVLQKKFKLTKTIIVIFC